MKFPKFKKPMGKEGELRVKSIDGPFDVKFKQIVSTKDGKILCLDENGQVWRLHLKEDGKVHWEKYESPEA